MSMTTAVKPNEKYRDFQITQPVLAALARASQEKAARTGNGDSALTEAERTAIYDRFPECFPVKK